MSDDNETQRSEAARAMGRAKTPRKQETARENAVKARQKRWDDPEARKRFGDAIREAARKRREAKAAENTTSTQDESSHRNGQNAREWHVESA